MQIIEKSITDISPYENNPRYNDEAVEAVAQSIKEFGFKVPIVIDKNNTIVTGHTRLKAAKRLGLESVPCILADDLTEDQIKAYRLADNKVGEFSTWNYIALDKELEGITDIDMTDFGFFKEDTGLDDLAFSEDNKTRQVGVKVQTKYECPCCRKKYTKVELICK